MTTTTTVRRSGRRRGPRMAIALSLLTFAVIFGAAVYVPSWLGHSPPLRQVQPVVTGPDQTQIDQARPQAALVAAEDARLIAQLRAIPFNGQPYLDRAHGAPTLILTARTDSYTLESLLVRGAAQRIDANTVAVTNSVLVGPGARLVLDAPGTTLRMSSTPTGFTSLVGWKGSITLTGAPGKPVTVTSWDPATSQPDQQVTDGRAYIRVAGSDLAIHSAAVSDLGFWSGRTGGLAITGSEIGAGTGAITDTTVHGDYYALFSSDTTTLTISGSTFDDAIDDGILLYEAAANTTIDNSTASGNGGGGIVATRGATDVTLRNVTTEHNGADGIRLDGRPLSDQPSAAGVSLDRAHGFRVSDAKTRFNAGNGVLAWAADDTVVTGTGVVGNAEGIVVRGAAHRVQISANYVISSTGDAIAVRDGATDVVVDHNALATADNGVAVRDSRADVHDNTITAARIHGVTFSGAAHGSAARGNTLAGSGPSSLDTDRLDTGAAVTVSDNSDNQWRVQMSTSDQLHWLFAYHPLLVVWAPLLLVPIVASLFGRRHRRRRRDALLDPPALPADGAPGNTSGDAALTGARSGAAETNGR